MSYEPIFTSSEKRAYLDAFFKKYELGERQIGLDKIIDGLNSLKASIEREEKNGRVYSRGEKLNCAFNYLRSRQKEKESETSVPRKRYKTLGEIYGDPVKRENEPAPKEYEFDTTRSFLEKNNLLPPNNPLHTNIGSNNSDEKGLNWLLKENPILPKKKLDIPLPKIGAFGAFARKEIDRKEGPAKNFDEHLERERDVMAMMGMKEKLDKRGSLGHYHFSVSDGGHKISMKIPVI